MGWDTHDEKLRIGDRQWTMRVSYGRLLERIGRPFGIFLFGFAIMLLAMQLHRLQQRRVGAFQALADEQALRAAERELMIGEKSGRAHVRTPVTNATIVCRYSLEKKKK